MPQRDLRYPSYPPPEPPAGKATLGWWGMGSIAAGAMAAACLPAALMGGKGWVTELSNVSPIWTLCCIIGVALGIRGTQKQRRASKRQRVTAFAGTLLSLITFMVLTIIVVVVGV